MGADLTSMFVCACSMSTSGAFQGDLTWCWVGPEGDVEAHQMLLVILVSLWFRSQHRHHKRYPVPIIIIMQFISF